MILNILITFLLVSLNGFFVAAEFSIVKVRTSQLELKSKKGDNFATLALHIVSHLDSYLAATQLGITLTSLGLGWIGEPVVSVLILKIMDLFSIDISIALAEKIALPIAFAVITFLHIILGELAPKSIAIQRSEKTALIIAYPLQFFYFIFKPFIWALNGLSNIILRIIGISPVHGAEVHSSEELKYLVRAGKTSGAIAESDYDIIKNAFDFSELTVNMVMVQRTEVVGINIASFNEAAIDHIISEGYSRMPCYEHSMDNVKGVVYLKDILLKRAKGKTIDIKELLRPIILVPANKRIGVLLKEFQQKHQQMALVLDEYGGTKGIVTMEDILEELVGEIQDEYDTEIPIVEPQGDKTFSVAASATIHDINELLPHPLLKGKEYETLAGKLIHNFNRFPSTNDKITLDGYEITILKKNKNAILLVQLQVLQK